MTILKADILSNLNTELERSENDIDLYIKRALRNIVTRIPAIKKTATFTLVAEQANYDKNTSGFPTDLRDIISIKIWDGTEYSEPLDRIPSWDMYLIESAGKSTSNSGEPTEYIMKYKTLYLYAKPDSAKTYVCYMEYSAIEIDPDSITLDDDFTDCLQYAVNFYYLASKGLAQQGQAQDNWGLYLDELIRINGLQDSRDGAKSVSYTDL